MRVGFICRGCVFQRADVVMPLAPPLVIVSEVGCLNTEVMLIRMQWMLTLRLNTFLLFTTPHNHTHKVFLIDVLTSHILSHSINSMPWDLALQPSPILRSAS